MIALFAVACIACGMLLLGSACGELQAGRDGRSVPVSLGALAVMMIALGCVLWEMEGVTVA